MRRLPWLVHTLIVVVLAVQSAYCGYQLLVTLRPEGGPAILFGAASSVPHELLVARRLYAIEGWVAFVGLCLYLGVTEILPHRLGKAGQSDDAGSS